MIFSKSTIASRRYVAKSRESVLASHKGEDLSPSGDISTIAIAL
jgi:hypothetical protein